MFNLFNIVDINHLPLQPNELATKSRRLTGYNLFNLHYYPTIEKMDYMEHKRLLIQHVSSFNDSTFLDYETRPAHLTTRPGMDYVSKVKLTASIWNSLAREMKATWNNRADMLNNQPSTTGIFHHYPQHLIQQIILDNINLETAYLFNFFQSVLGAKRLPKNNSYLFNKEPLFGYEKVQVESKLYREFHMSHILKNVIFSLNFQKLNRYTVYRTKSILICHVDSAEQLIDLFKVGASSPMEFFNGDGNITRKFAGYANVVSKDDPNACPLVGYMLKKSENSNQVRLELEDGCSVILPRPSLQLLHYCNHNNKTKKKWVWNYNNTNNASNYAIQDEFHPIRLKFRLNFGGPANCQIMCNIVQLSNNNIEFE